MVDFGVGREDFGDGDGDLFFGGEVGAVGCNFGDASNLPVEEVRGELRGASTIRLVLGYAFLKCRTRFAASRLGNSSEKRSA